MKRVAELNDAVWEAFDGALIGACIGIAAIVVAFIGGFLSWHYGQSPVTLGIFIAIGIAGSFIWYHLHQPWREAMNDTIEYREKLERETTKRGKGWAAS